MIDWIESKKNMVEHPLFTRKFEIIATRVQLEEAKRVLFVFSIFYPPNMLSDDVNKANELICKEVGRLKLKENDPMFIIAGDFNQKNYGNINAEFPDIHVLDTPPTRGNNFLDICLMNTNVNYINKLPPLASCNGSDSDHAILHVTFPIIKKEARIY